jgi:serine protease Do
VSKEAGFGDMPNHFLLTANLNEGNSGGPIFSRDGRVLGIAVAKLDKTKVLETTGMLPEDVNVGIKGQEGTTIPARKRTAKLRCASRTVAPRSLFCNSDHKLC